MFSPEVFKRVASMESWVRLLNYSLVWRPNGPGGESGVVPPVPMPNTAVKRSSAHDTGVTKPRENRPVPGPFGRHTRSCRHRGTVRRGRQARQALVRHHDALSMVGVTNATRRPSLKTGCHASKTVA